MTLEETCTIYATAWNTLNPQGLIDALDEEIIYSSQAVLTDMHGKEQVSAYLRAKINTIRAAPPEDQIFAQLAETQPYAMAPNPPQACVVLSQGAPEKLVATVLFKVAAGSITQIDMCIIPPPESTLRSGVFPR